MESEDFLVSRAKGVTLAQWDLKACRATKVFLKSHLIEQFSLLHVFNVGEQGIDGAPGLPGPQGENYEVRLFIPSFSPYFSKRLDNC